ASDRVAFTRSDFQHAPDLYVSSFPKVDAERVTDHNPQVQQLALGRSEVIRWRGRDGMEIEGILLYPVGYQAGAACSPNCLNSRRTFRSLVTGVSAQRQ